MPDKLKVLLLGKLVSTNAYPGVAVALHTFTSSQHHGPIAGDLLTALANTSVRFLVHNGAGYDPIDIDGCREAGIQVSNTPGAVDDSTADTAIFLLLGALRLFNPGLQSLRNGDFLGQPAIERGRDPQGKILGIIGMGGIGRKIRDRAQGFGMSVIYHNRRRVGEWSEGDAEYVGMDELLERSDAICLSLPLNDLTRHTIGKSEIGRMKHGVVIVNIARGGVIDEAALVEGLNSGKVYSAGLDVYEEEPMVHSGLLGNQRVILLPHMGTHSVETQEKMEMLAVQNIKSALETGQLKTPV